MYWRTLEEQTTTCLSSQIDQKRETLTWSDVIDIDHLNIELKILGVRLGGIPGRCAVVRGDEDPIQRLVTLSIERRVRPDRSIGSDIEVANHFRIAQVGVQSILNEIIRWIDIAIKGLNLCNDALATFIFHDTEHDRTNVERGNLIVLINQRDRRRANQRWIDQDTNVDQIDALDFSVKTTGDDDATAGDVSITRDSEVAERDERVGKWTGHRHDRRGLRRDLIGDRAVEPVTIIEDQAIRIGLVELLDDRKVQFFVTGIEPTGRWRIVTIVEIDRHCRVGLTDPRRRTAILSVDLKSDWEFRHIDVEHAHHGAL